MVEIKTILVPIDFSGSARDALAYAKTVAERFDASLHLVHVLPDPHEGLWSIAAAGASAASVATRWVREAESLLGQLLTDDERAARRAEVAVLEGHAFVEIVRYAKDHDIDLIVMGTHGRGPIEHMLVGSVAEKVVRQAPCPVLTVRTGQPKFSLV